ncbi:Ankyrin repeat domain containing protein [Pandoravirus salinus]|uniref:Ankyrin repeat domain containing protein n=1 Tax=Pandoravirus salinus TaxID=1349410 RepID=S4W027_9VIRU|nr:ankyrin repeat domain [Pandoravirus salinus]AGO85131.2 Ankyrin repeat domain containing protein [Pandoravirus salinus]
MRRYLSDGADAGWALDRLPRELLASVIAWLDNRDFGAALATAKAFYGAPSLRDAFVRQYGQLDLVEAVTVCPPDALGHLARHKSPTARFTTAHLTAAARAGRVDNVLWLRAHTGAAHRPVCLAPHRPYGTSPVRCLCGLVAAAAEAGHAGAVSALVATGCRVPTNAFAFAAQKGHADVLAALHHAAPYQGACTPEALWVAVDDDQVEIVRFLLTHRLLDCLDEIDSAARLTLDKPRRSHAILVALAHAHISPALLAKQIHSIRANTPEPETAALLDAIVDIECSPALDGDRRMAIVRAMLPVASDRDVPVLFADRDDRQAHADGDSWPRDLDGSISLPTWARLLLADHAPVAVAEVCSRYLGQGSRSALAAHIVGAVDRDAGRRNAAVPQQERWLALTSVLLTNGDLDAIDIITGADTDILWSVAAEAVRKNRLDVLERLDLRRPAPAPWWLGPADDAAGEGHLDILVYIHERGLFGFTTAAMDDAAASGHLDVVKWLHANRTEGCTTEAMDSAALGGHFDVVVYLHENRTEGCTTWAMDSVAHHPDGRILRFLHENRTEGCTRRAMNTAAAHGNIDNVRFLHENRTEGCTTHAMDMAAARHLDMVRWLYDNRTEGCSIRALYTAIRRRHTDTILYLLDTTDHDCDGTHLARAACLEPPTIFQRLCLRPLPSGPSTATLRDALSSAIRMNSAKAVKRLARRYPDHPSIFGFGALRDAVAERRSHMVECLVMEMPSVCDPRILRGAGGQCRYGTCRQWSTFYRRLAAHLDEAHDRPS